MEQYEYIAREAESTSALTDWSFEAYVTCETCVLPDGCRDIIVQHSEDRGSSWFISDLCNSAYKVPTSVGMRMRGLRLRPGVEILKPALCSWLHGRDPSALFDSDQIGEFCVKKENVENALECLSSGKRTVSCVAKELGVSLRTLERLVKTDTGQSPYYWFSLARARRACRSIVNCDSLSDTAIETGFADQAHMNREIKKWFKLTPNQIRSGSEMHHLFFEAGYG